MMKIHRVGGSWAKASQRQQVRRSVEVLCYRNDLSADSLNDLWRSFDTSPEQRHARRYARRLWALWCAGAIGLADIINARHRGWDTLEQKTSRTLVTRHGELWHGKAGED